MRHRELVLMNHDGTNLRALTQGEGAEALMPAWYGGGTRASPATASGSSKRVAVMNADGTGVRELGLGNEADWR